MSSENSSSNTSDPYETLGIERGAGDDEIKRAYFQMVRDHPPEREPSRFSEIRAAYDRIRTADRRARTNLFLLQPAPPLPARRPPSYDFRVHPADVILIAFEAVASRISTQSDFHEPRLPE